MATRNPPTAIRSTPAWIEDGFIHRQTATPGNAHDSTERDTILLGDEVALYADAACSSRTTRKKLERFGIEDQVQRKGYRGHPLSAADVIRNDKIAVSVIAESW